MAVNGRALAATFAGSVFIWSGIRGWSVMGTIGDLITGHKPTAHGPAVPLTVTTGSATDGPAGVAAGTLAGEAMKYRGHAYLFGGTPGEDGSRPWDCSSFVNWVASVRMGLPIPGYGPGKYRGTSHGPPTGMWGVWPGLRHVKRSEVQAGDIIVWVGHMGIATSSQTMVSALNSNVGTVESAIEGYGNGPVLCYGRYQ